jgi:hypothetical protein
VTEAHYLAAGIDGNAASIAFRRDITPRNASFGHAQHPGVAACLGLLASIVAEAMNCEAPSIHEFMISALRGPLSIHTTGLTSCSAGAAVAPRTSA